LTALSSHCDDYRSQWEERAVKWYKQVVGYKERFREKEVQYDQSMEELVFSRTDQNTEQEDNILLKEEIERYEKELKLFDINFEDLILETPKHKDTKQNAVDLAEKISSDPPLVDELNKKKKLPVSKIVLKYETTKKVLKRSRKFIISLIIIFTGDFNQLSMWVRKSLKR